MTTKEDLFKTRHGESGGRKHVASPEYRSYKGARGRCTNPNNKAFRSYGGRGIEFRFDSFEQFLDIVGRRPSQSHSLDRIDNDGHYEPGNVRWATAKEQSSNTRSNRTITHGGVTLTVTGWAERLGLSKNAVIRRLACGWCDDCAVTLPQKEVCLHRVGVQQLRLLTFRGQSLSIGEWADLLGIQRQTIRRRLEKGLSVEESLTSPANTPKLNPEQVRQITRALSDGKTSQRQLAKQFNVNPMTISNIKRGVAWAHI